MHIGIISKIPHYYYSETGYTRIVCATTRPFYIRLEYSVQNSCRPISYLLTRKMYIQNLSCQLLINNTV